MAKKEKTVNHYLNFLKGFAIFLVVLGHAIQTSGISYDENSIFRLIYSFHMPLFMFISGSVAAYSTRPYNRAFIKNKFMTLIVPFLSWGIIGYFLTSAFISTSFLHYMKRLVAYPDTGLWFLPVLFTLFMLLFVIEKSKQRIGTAAFLAIPFLFYALPATRFGLGLVRWHLPFFLAAYYMTHHKIVVARYRKLLGLISVICFVVLVGAWYRTKNPFFADNIDRLLGRYGVGAIQVGDYLTFNFYQFLITSYKYLVAFSGIGTTLYLLAFAYRSHLAKKILLTLGNYTIDIYAISNYLLFLGFGPFAVYVLSASLFATVGSLALSVFIIRKFQILRVLLLGGR